METKQSLQIIESMFAESRKSLHKNSFYFILWGALLMPLGIAESLFYGEEMLWVQWPVVGIIGGLISGVYGKKEDKRSGISTMGDRITSYTWGAFAVTMIIAIVYTVSNQLHPAAMILLLAGSATFISGGISKFKPFVWGGIALEIGALCCAFVLAPQYHGLVFSASLLLGYLIPGIMLKKSENGAA